MTRPLARSTRACTVLISVLAATAASAQGRPVAIVPLVGARGGATLEADVPGTPGIEADPSESYGLQLDVAVRPDAWMETWYDHQTLSFDDDRGSGAEPFDLAIDYLQLGWRYQPGTDAFRPFVAASVGLTLYDADGGDVSNSTGFSGSLGGGFDASLSDRISLRGDLRGYATLSDTTISGTCGAGCSVRLQSSGWYQIAARLGLVIRM
jgi:hypothetical protein